MAGDLDDQPVQGGGGGGGERWDVRVQHQVNEYEHGVRDVEEELHRRLKARQVRLLSVLERAGRQTPLVDFNDCIRRDDRYRFSHWYRDGFTAR